ncbi:MAG: 16S rRNA (cytosine(1402)-N(4))-methyltransferase RsmH [Saprospiraceae bacterium]
MAYHLPVLAAQSIEALNIQPAGVYVDATYGGGGHAKLIVQALGDKGRLFGFDQDEDALQNALTDERFTFVQSNFRYLKRFLRLHGVKTVHGILADLGVSSHQLDEATRGFSYRFDNQLDMRMNQEDERTAATVVNTYTAEELQRVFSEYGEVRNARTLAQRIVEERRTRPIQTVNDLLAIMEPLIRGQRLRYLSQVFQALRIEVNDEMGALREFLEQALEVLAPEGRLVVITYHSLEDRLVKNFIKTGNAAGEVKSDFYGNISRPFKVITKNPIEPTEAEIEQNSRARSAKLRVGEKVS